MKIRTADDVCAIGADFVKRHQRTELSDLARQIETAFRGSSSLELLGVIATALRDKRVKQFGAVTEETIEAVDAFVRHAYTSKF